MHTNIKALIPCALAVTLTTTTAVHAVVVDPVVSNTTAIAFTSVQVPDPDPLVLLGVDFDSSGEVELADAAANASVASVPSGGAETATGAAEVNLDPVDINNSVFRAKSEVSTAPPPAVPTPPVLDIFGFNMLSQSLAGMSATLSTEGLVNPGETAMVNLSLNISGTLVYNDPTGTASAEVITDPFDESNMETVHDMSTSVSALLLLADVIEVTDEIALGLDFADLPVVSLFNGSATLASIVGGGTPALTRVGDWSDPMLDGNFVMDGICTPLYCEYDIETSIIFDDVQSIGFGETFEVGLLLFTSVEGVSANINDIINDGRRLESNFFDTASFQVTLDLERVDAVPEPWTVVMLLSGLAGLGISRGAVRRRH